MTAERVTEREAQADLAAVLQLVAAGRLRCSIRTRRPSRATVRTVDEVLSGGDFYMHEAIRAFAWPLLLQSGGLATLSSGRLELTPRGHKALVCPASETIRDLWQRWLSHGALDELSRVEGIKGQRGLNVLSPVRPRRKAIDAALAKCCPPGEWILIDQLFTAMRIAGHDPVVVRSRGALWQLYLEDPQYGSLGHDGFDEWPLLQGRYTLCVLFEYAATLGLIDVRYTAPGGARDDFRRNWGNDGLDRLSRYDGLLAVRLNPLGIYATGQVTRPCPDVERSSTPSAAQCPVQVLANFDLVAPAGLATADKLLLDAFATRASGNVWTLSTASLLKALYTGRSLDELHCFLTRGSGQPIPQTVQSLLADAAARTRRVWDAGAYHLLVCVDETQTALFAEDATLRELCSRVGDRHLAVATGDLPAFRHALLNLGYVLPGPSPSAPETLDLKVQGNGCPIAMKHDPPE